MRIDLHTHSDRSDGTDGPGELMARAVAVGLDVVALTDHDTAAGWEAAREAATRIGIGFVPGMEISCSYRGVGVHLLAYLLDPTYPPLAEELRRVLDGRSARLPATLRRLSSLGIDITAEDVLAVSESAEATGRPHVADALVAKGVVGSRNEAFERYLSQGRPGYVERYAADLVPMLHMVREAGGVPVLAHPWGRHSRDALDAQALEALQREGLAGLEVDHQDHDEHTRRELRGIASSLGLLQTGASDFHGEGKTDCPLGANVTDPEQLQRLLETAGESARAAGRPTPEPVLP